MNLKTIKTLIGIKSNPEQSPAMKAMAERVSTLAGCQALEHELTQRRQALPSHARAARQLARKIEELQRLQKGLAVSADRQRLADVVKADQEDGSKALKAAESKLTTATEAAALADAQQAERAALVDQLNQELAALHTQADQAVTSAEARLREVITSGADQAAEVAAFDDLKKAQLHRATCGESLAVRIKGHETELRRLQGAAADATAQQQAAQDAVTLCRVKLARVAYDVAVQGLLDAFVTLRALPATDSTGKPHALSEVHTPVVTFASKDRALLGERVCGESQRVRDWALADLANVQRPANLVLLAEPLADDTPEPEQALPNPYSFTPGSVAFENAKEAQKRHAMGADAYEESLRAEQRTPLNA